MADFKTKITADGKQFNDEMNKAAQKGKSFERQIQETSKGMNAFTNKANILASAIKAMPFVAAGAAIAGFAKKGLEATQASDGMRNTMAALNTTVTSFFGSIMSGDWSAFNNGITEAFNNAKRFREAMDSLGDALLSKKIFDAEIMDEYTAALADASDMSLSLEDRQKALASAQASVAKMTENNVHVAQRLNTSLSALWKQETGQEFTEETIREVSKAGDVYDDLAAKINNAATKIRNASLTVSQSSVGASSSYSKTIQQAREEAIELLATQNEGSKEQLRLASLWQNFNDKERQQNAELLIQYSNQNREINQMERGLIRLSNRINRESSKPTSVKVVSETQAVVDALTREYVERERLTAAMQRMAVAAKDIADARLKEIKASTPSMSSLSPASLASTDKVAANSLDVLNVMREESIRQLNRLTIGSAAYIDKQRQIADYDNKIAKANVDNTVAMSEALAALGQSTMSISDNPAIKALGLSLMIAGSMKGIGEAFSKNVWYGIAAAAAAAASVIATVSSMKSAKFAQGGIVGGSSYAGDNVHAMVNSGEMILTRSQQSRLFDMLNDGNAGNSSNAIELRLRGTDLVGLIRNTSAKYSL